LMKWSPWDWKPTAFWEETVVEHDQTVANVAGFIAG